MKITYGYKEFQSIQIDVKCKVILTPYPLPFPRACCYCSVAKSCPTLCDPMDCITDLCSSLSPWVCSNSCPLSQWCYPTMSFSVAPFSQEVTTVYNFLFTILININTYIGIFYTPTHKWTCTLPSILFSLPFKWTTSRGFFSSP